MVFEVSWKFFHMGYRSVKKSDEEYGIYLSDVQEKNEMLTSFYKSDLYKTFLDNGYVSVKCPVDIKKYEEVSFKKNLDKHVEINNIKMIFPADKTGGKEVNYDIDFHVQIDGSYGMVFEDGRISEGYKALRLFSNEVVDILTNKLSKKPQTISEEDGE
jgi:hypothetical protein